MRTSGRGERRADVSASVHSRPLPEPEGHGAIEPERTFAAEGPEPALRTRSPCYVRFGDDGETIAYVGSKGARCAISQAGASMLTELVKARGVRGGDLPSTELREEISVIPADADPAQVRQSSCSGG